MSDPIYDMYARTKRLIKSAFDAEPCDDKRSTENLFMIEEWRKIIKYIDQTYPTVTALYDRRQNVIESFTAEQIDHICYQIGDWYFMMKPLLEANHNLGYMKERLKNMICGE